MRTGARVGRVKTIAVASWTALSIHCTRASGRDTLESGVTGRSAVVSVANLSPDAGRSSSPGVSSSECSSGAIVNVLEYATSRLGWRSHIADIHRDDDFAKAQATFLGRDLGIASLFRSRTSVAFANVFETVEGRRLHLGVVEIVFPRCADLERAMAAISRVRRDYFNVAAPSVFRTLRRERSLVVIFSESPLEPSVKELLHSTARDALSSPTCRDGHEP